MNDLHLLAGGAGAIGVRLDDGQLSQFRAYLAGLAEWNARTNLTSPAALVDAERVHLLDSLTLVPVIEREAAEARRLVDVGSGAGFPGLAVKVAMPALHVVLVEATRKKADFLRWTAQRLGLDGVEVVAERAEVVGRDAAFRETFDVATARAVGSLPAVLELTLPLCRVGGVLLAQRGADGEAEASASTKALRELGGEVTEAVTSDSETSQGRVVVIVRKVRPTPERYPRRTGVPAKRPLA